MKDSKLKNTFRTELSLIKDDNIRQFTKEVLEGAPDSFYTISASSSGVNHPKTSQGLGGNLIHTQSAFWIGYTICRSTKQISQMDIDIILAAILLHDINKGEYGLDEHARKGRQFIKLHAVSYNEHRIADIVGTHMGYFDSDNGYSEKDICQFIVHTADYISSRKWCLFDRDEIDIDV